MHKLVSAIVFTTMLLPGTLMAAKADEQRDDVIARVGDEAITFSQISTMLNSSAVVGVSIPAIGTPARDTVRIALLDKMVSANLLYLDALRLGLDKDPDYRRDMVRFEDGILAGLYAQREMTRDTAVGEAEIQGFYEQSVVPGTELTDDGRAQIEAVLRKRKADEHRNTMLARMQQFRNEAGVTVNEDSLLVAGDDTRTDDAVVASIGKQAITWGEVKQRLIAAGEAAAQRDILAMEDVGRLNALQALIDTIVLSDKARDAGLDQGPVFLGRVREYRKTRLINLHRANLAREFEPSDEELNAYFEANKARITVPEARKVQMVVVETEQEANEIKNKITAGKLTMYQAARDHSIDPGAKQNLGEIGWVEPGQGQPALDEATFALGPDEVGGPYETPAGWHLLKVMDVRDERYGDLADAETRKKVRRTFIHDKLDAYVVDLRKKGFEVVVYEDNLRRLAQAEANMVARLVEQAKQPGSITEQRVRELQKIIPR